MGGSTSQPVSNLMQRHIRKFLDISGNKGLPICLATSVRVSYLSKYEKLYRLVSAFKITKLISKEEAVC